MLSNEREETDAITGNRQHREIGADGRDERDVPLPGQEGGDARQDPAGGGGRQRPRRLLVRHAGIHDGAVGGVMDFLRESMDRLTEEAMQIEYELRVVLPKEINTAPAHGDTAENGEDDTAKERQITHNARLAHTQ